MKTIKQSFLAALLCALTFFSCGQSQSQQRTETAETQYITLSAEQLKNYEGKCRNLHGHRWRVVAEIAGETLCEGGQTDGMLMDFSDVKHTLGKLCDEFDHCLIYERGSLRLQTIQALAKSPFAWWRWISGRRQNILQNIFLTG